VFRECVLESDTPTPPPPASTGVRIGKHFAFRKFLRAIRSGGPLSGEGGVFFQTNDVGQDGGRGGVQNVSFC